MPVSQALLFRSDRLASDQRKRASNRGLLSPQCFEEGSLGIGIPRHLGCLSRLCPFRKAHRQQKPSFAALEELYRDRFTCLAVLAAHGLNLDRLALADLLRIVRVYTKAPGKIADLISPFVPRRGQTVLDARPVGPPGFRRAPQVRAPVPSSARGMAGWIEGNHLLEDWDILEFTSDPASGELLVIRQPAAALPA